ncbi:MAG TPA: TAXI family TRAP transporter solute-binding subunit, partial [Pseudogracilibacillus sp.]|nr:TAXI family TRAP transporter solute-binding subunit [Pseudogracilibacillus sp.]
MKKRPNILMVALLFVFALFLAACGNDGGENGNADNNGEEPDFMNILTGGTSGTYYPLGGEMASVIEDETDIQADAVSSNATADNIVDLSAGEAEIAMVQTDVMSDAVDGINSFEDEEKVENLQAIGSLYPETIQIVTTEDMDIDSIEDLEGKKVSMGAPGSGTYVNAEQILDLYG